MFGSCCEPWLVYAEERNAMAHSCTAKQDAARSLGPNAEGDMVCRTC